MVSTNYFFRFPAEVPMLFRNYDSCERFRDDNEDKNPYYEGFIDGCKSVEGNAKEICESAGEPVRDICNRWGPKRNMY